MNPRSFFIPGMAINPNIMRSGYGSNFIGRIFSGIRSFNWEKLLTGTSKTLNVVNQAIPVVKQAKPMVGNVKRLVKLARAFGSETTKTQTIKKNDDVHVKQNILKEKINDTNYPNFFI